LGGLPRRGAGRNVPKTWGQGFNRVTVLRFAGLAIDQEAGLYWRDWDGEVLRRNRRRRTSVDSSCRVGADAARALGCPPKTARLAGAYPIPGCCVGFVTPSDRKPAKQAAGRKPRQMAAGPFAIRRARDRFTGPHRIPTGLGSATRQVILERRCEFRRRVAHPASSPGDGDGQRHGLRQCSARGSK